MSIATLDPVEAIRDFLIADKIIGLEADLDEADRLKSLVGVGETARVWSPVAGLYDDPVEGLAPWTNQVPAIVFETNGERPQADEGSITVQAVFKCYGGPDDEEGLNAPTYRMARKLGRALRARLHNKSGQAAGGRWLMRADQNIGTQAPVDEDGFPFYLAGYAVTLQ